MIHFLIQIENYFFFLFFSIYHFFDKSVMSQSHKLANQARWAGVMAKRVSSNEEENVFHKRSRFSLSTMYSANG